MSKRNKIIYWIATLWASLGIVSSAVVQLYRQPTEVASVTSLGYPVYFLTILGIWKMLGVVALLVPRFPLVKEWAYAGFFFAMSGAAISRIVSGNSMGEIFPSLFILTLVLISWYFRPADRKVVSAIQ